MATVAMGLGQFWRWPWCRAPLWPWLVQGLAPLAWYRALQAPFYFLSMVVDIVGDCGSLSLSLWVWAYNWLAAVGRQCELKEHPLSLIVPLLATERSVFSLHSRQIHSRCFGSNYTNFGLERTVLALKVLQQHTVLLHKVPPTCPGRFPTLSVLWSSFKLTKS